MVDSVSLNLFIGKGDLTRQSRDIFGPIGNVTMVPAGTANAEDCLGLGMGL
jgi:hypothetical protein